MRTAPAYRQSNPLKTVLAIVVVAAIVALVLVLDVPSRIAALGSGNLDHLVAPTTTAEFGEPVRLAGRGTRPPLEVTAGKAVTVRSQTKRVRADKGNRFVAVDVSVQNVGNGPWVPDLGTTMTVIDQRGAAHTGDLRVTRVRGGRLLHLAPSLKPKATVRGLAVFQVPRSATVTTVTFTVGSGLTRTAKWVEKKD